MTGPLVDPPSELSLKSRRKWLRTCVKRWLVPEFEKLGFATTPVGREVRRDLPFGILRRSRDGLVDIVEIDFFHRSSHPGFRIFFASLPAGPWSHGGQVFRNEEVLVGWLPESYEMPRGMRWFHVKKWPWSPPPTKEDYERLVKEVASMVFEAEAALISGKIGPHVRFVRMHP